MEDFPFYAFHLRSRASVQPEQQRHSEQCQQSPLQSPFKAIKNNIIKETERLRDLQSPFRSNIGNTLPKAELNTTSLKTGRFINDTI